MATHGVNNGEYVSNNRENTPDMLPEKEQDVNYNPDSAILTNGVNGEMIDRDLRQQYDEPKKHQTQPISNAYQTTNSNEAKATNIEKRKTSGVANAVPSPKSHHKHRTEGNTVFLRAARAGNMEKLHELLKQGFEINTSNSNGLNALHLASKEGHKEMVKELLSLGANPDSATKKGNTAMHIASLAGQFEIVKILIQAGATTNCQSQNGFTPLYMAAQENHWEIVQHLLTNGASQTLATEDGFTPLAVALQQGHDKVVAVLLENDTRGKIRLPALHIAAKKDDVRSASLLLGSSEHNVDVQSKSGFTPLHIAAHYGNIDVANLLITRGADSNFRAKNSITPLHVASKWGRTAMVTLLLQHKAAIDAVTKDKLTPLHCASRSGNHQTVDILLQHGASHSAKTKNGLTALHMAAQGDHIDCARLLLYHNATVDDVTVDYLTPLHVASHCGNIRVARLLLDRKCDVNARALNGFTPLHIACKKNRTKMIELLLKYGGNLEATTESGLTPLHVASFMGHMNVVIFLLQKGSNPDYPTIRGETPLHLATRSNQLDVMRVLLRHNAQVDAKAREHQTPLHVASRSGNVDIVELLLQHNASVDSVTVDLYTPLHIAAKEGQDEVANILLDHGASYSNTTKKGFTALHIASKYGHVHLVRLLLKRQADPDTPGKNGLTAVHIATHYAHPDVVSVLIENGASPHVTTKNGYTPLHIGARKNQANSVMTLLTHGAHVNAESKNGFTSLHLATLEGHINLVQMLISNGANVNASAKNGLTALHLCAQEDFIKIADILANNQVDINSRTRAGYTPLHTACHFGQTHMIKYLLEQGADVNSLTRHGYSPLHQAAQQGHMQQVIYLLLKYGANPNILAENNQTALSIAQQLQYLSIVEILKPLTDVSSIKSSETKYEVLSPETMQEAFLSDSEAEDEHEQLMSQAPIMPSSPVFINSASEQKFFQSKTKSSSDIAQEPRESDKLPKNSTSLEYATELRKAPQGPNETNGTQDEIKETDDHRVMDKNAEVKIELLRGTELTTTSTVDSPSVTANATDSMMMLDTSAMDTTLFGYSFDPKDVKVDRTPNIAGFLVSFMVDARGGILSGSRHSGIRILVPPRHCSAPTRVTCRLMRRERVAHPPPLMEGESLAARIIEIGPIGTRFLGSVVIEIPHYASLRAKERELTVLRSEDGRKWTEHHSDCTDMQTQQLIEKSFKNGTSVEAAESHFNRQCIRIVTQEFPHYFAVVTRIKQETYYVGAEGATVSSTVVPTVQAVFPSGSLTKKIKVGLQAFPIPLDLVARLLGNRVAVSPIVTVEPRRRKFHKPITLTIPLPIPAKKGMVNQYSTEPPTLRLLCSITGGTTPAQWEDITGTTPLTFAHECVSFTTTVSARFWLMDCQNIGDSARMATEIYRHSVIVPFMAKFVVFAKRHDINECRLRVFCATDDRIEKTLERQQKFKEIARSKDVEVYENRRHYMDLSGNLTPVAKSGDKLSLTFRAFRENRLPFIARIRDTALEPSGRLTFVRDKSLKVSETHPPICMLAITLPEYSPTVKDLTLSAKLERRPIENVMSANLRLSDIASEVLVDWVSLARKLNFSESEVNNIKLDYIHIADQALSMLNLWFKKSGNKADGDQLANALREIGREDVISKCMFNTVRVHLDSEREGFEAFKDELGPSRDSSLRSGATLDISSSDAEFSRDTTESLRSASSFESVIEKPGAAVGIMNDINRLRNFDDATTDDISGASSMISGSQRSPATTNDINTTPKKRPMPQDMGVVGGMISEKPAAVKKASSLKKRTSEKRRSRQQVLPPDSDSETDGEMKKRSSVINRKKRNGDPNIDRVMTQQPPPAPTIADLDENISLTCDNLSQIDDDVHLIERKVDERGNILRKPLGRAPDHSDEAVNQFVDSMIKYGEAYQTSCLSEMDDNLVDKRQKNDPVSELALSRVDKSSLHALSPHMVDNTLHSTTGSNIQHSSLPISDVPSETQSSAEPIGSVDSASSSSTFSDLIPPVPTEVTKQRFIQGDQVTDIRTVRTSTSMTTYTSTSSLQNNRGALLVDFSSTVPPTTKTLTCVAPTPSHDQSILLSHEHQQPISSQLEDNTKQSHLGRNSHLSRLSSKEDYYSSSSHAGSSSPDSVIFASHINNRKNDNDLLVDTRTDEKNLFDKLTEIGDRGDRSSESSLSQKLSSSSAPSSRENSISPLLTKKVSTFSEESSRGPMTSSVCTSTSTTMQPQLCQMSAHDSLPISCSTVESTVDESVDLALTELKEYLSHHHSYRQPSQQPNPPFFESYDDHIDEFHSHERARSSSLEDVSSSQHNEDLWRDLGQDDENHEYVTDLGDAYGMEQGIRRILPPLPTMQSPLIDPSLLAYGNSGMTEEISGASVGVIPSNLCSIPEDDVLPPERSSSHLPDVEAYHSSSDEGSITYSSSSTTAQRAAQMSNNKNVLGGSSGFTPVGTPSGFSLDQSSSPLDRTYESGLDELAADDEMEQSGSIYNNQSDAGGFFERCHSVDVAAEAAREKLLDENLYQRVRHHSSPDRITMFDIKTEEDAANLLATKVAEEIMSDVVNPSLTSSQEKIDYYDKDTQSETKDNTNISKIVVKKKIVTQVIQRPDGTIERETVESAELHGDDEVPSELIGEITEAIQHELGKRVPPKRPSHSPGSSKE